MTSTRPPTRELTISFRFISLALALALAVSLVNLFLRLSGDDTSSARKADSAIPRRGESSAPEVVAIETRQSADGMSDAEFDMFALSVMEGLSVASTRKWIKRAYQENGVVLSDSEIQIESDSQFVIQGGAKIGVIRMRATVSLEGGARESARALRAFRIEGTDVRGVSCLRYSDERIPVWSGPCGAKMREVFGVGLEPPLALAD